MDQGFSIHVSLKNRAVLMKLEKGGGYSGTKKLMQYTTIILV